MTVRLSRRAQARAAVQTQTRIACAVLDLSSPDENVRAEAVRQLCPCRTHLRWTLDQYVVPMLHDESAIVRRMANVVLSEELEHEMVREARAAQPRGTLAHPPVPRRRA